MTNLHLLPWAEKTVPSPKAETTATEADTLSTLTQRLQQELRRTPPQELLALLAQKDRRFLPVQQLWEKKRQAEALQKSGPMGILAHAAPQLQGLLGMMNGMKGLSLPDLLSR